jgi:hypothetical protein
MLALNLAIMAFEYVANLWLVQRDEVGRPPRI